MEKNVYAAGLLALVKEAEDRLQTDANPARQALYGAPLAELRAQLEEDVQPAVGVPVIITDAGEVLEVATQDVGETNASTTPAIPS